MAPIEEGVNASKIKKGSEASEAQMKGDLNHTFEHYDCNFRRLHEMRREREHEARNPGPPYQSNLDEDDSSSDEAASVCDYEGTSDTDSDEDAAPFLCDSSSNSDCDWRERDEDIESDSDRDQENHGLGLNFGYLQMMQEARENGTTFRELCRNTERFDIGSGDQ